MALKHWPIWINDPYHTYAFELKQNALFADSIQNWDYDLILIRYIFFFFPRTRITATEMWKEKIAYG